MNTENDPKRNKPSNVGRDNDPNSRDESGIQPGTSTISPSGNDEANQRTTKSAMDFPAQTDFDTNTNADAAFDDVEKSDS